jgi:hypothetical protein
MLFSIPFRFYGETGFLFEIKEETANDFNTQAHCIAGGYGSLLYF